MRCATTKVVWMCLGARGAAVHGQAVDLGRAGTPTVEQARNPESGGEALRCGNLAELSPEVAAALAEQPQDTTRCSRFPCDSSPWAAGA